VVLDEEWRCREDRGLVVPIPTKLLFKINILELRLMKVGDLMVI
jgi:hypothetical protein